MPDAPDLPLWVTLAGMGLTFLATFIPARMQVQDARRGRRDAEAEAERQRTASSREADKGRQLERDLAAAQRQLETRAMARSFEQTALGRINEAWALAEGDTPNARKRGRAMLEAMLEETELSRVAQALLDRATDDVLSSIVDELPGSDEEEGEDLGD